jgi:NAD(P)-dependent dehydrogenase (short-subunit alcohol dehydrogenase family)
MSEPADLFSLKGKRVLVTGASSGLGEHFARLVAQRGAVAILAARRREPLERLAEEIRESGSGAIPITMDVTDPASIEAGLERAGIVDVLINNAGVTLSRPALEQSAADWDRVIDPNLKGAFMVATAVGRRMRDAGGGGSIVNIASILGLRQAGTVVGYGVSKAGLIQLTKLLAAELARYDIRVNALAPGYIDTDLNRDFWGTDAGRALIKRIPQRRLGRPDELDGALLLLASGASRYMTGTVIAIDGGHLCSSL